MIAGLLREQKEETIRESEERYRTLFELSPIGILTLDLEGVITSCNPAVYEKGGYTKDDFAGKHFSKIASIRPEEIPGYTRLFDSILKDRILKPFEAPYHRKDGTIDWEEIHIAALATGDKKLGILVLHNDITERKKAEEDIKNYQDRLRALASQLIVVEEEEKRHLATELHDSIGQLLALCRIKLGELEKMTEASDARSLVRDVEERLEEIIWKTRSLTSELGPSVLYQLGLEPALDWLVEYMQEQYGILTKVKFTGKSELVNEELRVFLFRTVQELLLNVSKHAKTDKAQVSISTENESVQISVEDKGVGFDPADMEISSGKDVGFGLFSIRERIHYFGGKLELRTNPGEGTQVRITVPIKD